MKTDKHKTKVLFLIEKPEIIDGKNIGSDVFAYFPENIEGWGKRACYAHIGQHSVCSIEYANECKQAHYNEYQDLLKELISIGYNLDIQNVNQVVTYHRQPTPSEIKFGHGATHYRDFNIRTCIKRDGNLKKRLKADDGLIYTR